jgi:carboxypeptidase family protein
MLMFKRGCVVLLVCLASACGGGNSTVTSSSPRTFLPNPILLTGRVTDSTTSAPISGATVLINGRYSTTTDSSGNYNVSFLDGGSNSNITYVSANNYAPDYRYIRATSQNVHLYPIVSITAGDSTVVTIAPDDTLCVNNVQDIPGLGPDYLCRSVRVVAPSNGVMTLEAVSTQGAARPPLEVEASVSPCCSERMGNPTSIQVTAGTEVVAHVEMNSSSTTSQSFRLSTSMAKQ